MGLYFEDFAPGFTHETPSRTLMEAEIDTFAELSGDFNPLHMDAAFAAENGYGGRITHGPMIVGMALGLASPLLNGTAIGLLEIGWTFKRALWPGDSISVRVQVKDTQPSRKPDRGMVEVALEVLNQDRDIVQAGSAKLLVRRRHAPDPEKWKPVFGEDYAPPKDSA